VSLNNYFVERRNQFQKSTLQKLHRANPFRSIVPMSAMDLTEGRTPTVRTLTHELPTAYPTALTAVGISDGSTSPCDITPTVIKRGEVHRTFELYGTSWETDELCLSDLKRAQDAADAVAAFERGLNEYLTVWWSDWYRIQNIGMSNNKVGTGASGALVSATSTNANHASLGSLPAADIEWDHLKQVYWELVRSGYADEMAVGRDSKGRPILPLCAGAGIINRLWNVDAGVKEQVKYFDSAKNLQALGYDGAVHGFIPMLDLFPVRYGKASTGITAVNQLVAAQMLYPTENVNAATTGRTYRNNANYKVVANGGLAEYEVVTILGKNVWEAKYEALNPANFASASFKPQNYVGEFEWINNPTYRGTNDKRNKGYYSAEVRVGSKPLFPEFGYTILTRAKDV
jgi:hypothetical protein